MAEAPNLDPKHHVHGVNLFNKARGEGISREVQRILEEEIIPRYLDWHNQNSGQISPKERVRLVNDYKDFLAQENYRQTFSPQSKLHSTVVEEFLFYLFRDLPRLAGLSLQIGCGIRAYSNLYFSPPDIREFSRAPHTRINEKDQDFAIYRPVRIVVENEELTINVPVVSVECKTYLDKTMLEGSVATAEKIKFGNPYCLFLVVTETYDVSTTVDPKYSRIDQIFVLRKGFRKEMVNPIQEDVVVSLFRCVEGHFEKEWSAVAAKITRNGVVL